MSKVRAIFSENPKKIKFHLPNMEEEMKRIVSEQLRGGSSIVQETDVDEKGNR